MLNYIKNNKFNFATKIKPNQINIYLKHLLINFPSAN